MSFSDFALHPVLQQALAAEGYTEATPVQTAAIPPAIEGRDLLATAQTGTGKTAAFMLPALNRLAGQPAPRPAGAPRILVLAPTRELARQVLTAARKYAKFMRLHSCELVGGLPYRDQLRMLSRPLDLVVATPGRLLDHLERGRLHLDGVEVLVLDEADRMLDMGFLSDVEAAAAACSPTRQTMLFTATLDDRMAKLSGRLLKDPVRIAIDSRPTAAPTIDQKLLHADDISHKRRMLLHLVGDEQVQKGIIFTATKRSADDLAGDLLDAGHSVGALHGDMSQGHRNRTLDMLRRGEIRLLVATDVAARGIDVRDISHVINFDLPRMPEDYLHRIGRTGRAGAEGVAISFASQSDREALLRIHHYTKTEMRVEVIPGLEARRPVILTRTPVGGKPGKSGGRPGGAGRGAPGGGPRGPRPAGNPGAGAGAGGHGRPAAPAGQGQHSHAPVQPHGQAYAHHGKPSGGPGAAGKPAGAPPSRDGHKRPPSGRPFAAPHGQGAGKHVPHGGPRKGRGGHND